MGWLAYVGCLEMSAFPTTYNQASGEDVNRALRNRRGKIIQPET